MQLPSFNNIQAYYWTFTKFPLHKDLMAIFLLQKNLIFHRMLLIFINDFQMQGAFVILEESWEHEQRLKNLKPIYSQKYIKLNERKQKHQQKLKEELMTWNPFEDSNILGDPFKTLFAGRLDYNKNEKKLRKEFSDYGPIKSIKIVKKEDKSRGYAFIGIKEYDKNDMKTAYKYENGRKIDRNRVLVDIEKGRTISNWRPRRLGQGLGDTRQSKSEEGKQKYDENGENGENDDLTGEYSHIRRQTKSASRERNSSYEKQKRRQSIFFLKI